MVDRDELGGQPQISPPREVAVPEPSKGTRSYSGARHQILRASRLALGALLGRPWSASRALSGPLTAREHGDGNTLDPPEDVSGSTLEAEGRIGVANRLLDGAHRARAATAIEDR